MAVIVVEPFREAEDMVVGTITPETADCALMTTADAARMAVVYFILTGR